MFNQIGPLEIAIVLVVVLLIFGPKRLPGLGRSLGAGMREFKDSITGKDSERGDEAPAERAALTRAQESGSEDSGERAGETAGQAAGAADHRG